MDVEPGSGACLGGGYSAEPVVPQAASEVHYQGLIQVEVVMHGLTPLLQNALSREKLHALWVGSGNGKRGKAAARPQPREHAESVLYRLPDGRPHVPVRCFYACLIAAGQFVRLDGKRQISTQATTRLPGMVSVLDTVMPLTRHDGVTPAAWEVDLMQGRNPNGGEAVCIVRPRFDEWRLSCTLEVDQDQIPLPAVRSLVDIAGSRVGLLEYTPRHRGTFGRFTVVSWEPCPNTRR